MQRILAQMAARIVRRKRGMEWEFPVWLIWMLVALVVLLLIIGLATGTIQDLVGKLIELVRFA